MVHLRNRRGVDGFTASPSLSPPSRMTCGPAMETDMAASATSSDATIRPALAVTGRVRVTVTTTVITTLTLIGERDGAG